MGNIWQRNYYEHIIRGGDDYERIAGYIMDNPLNWDRDSKSGNPCQTIISPRADWDSNSCNLRQTIRITQIPRGQKSARLDSVDGSSVRCHPPLPRMDSYPPMKTKWRQRFRYRQPPCSVSTVASGTGQGRWHGNDAWNITDADRKWWPPGPIVTFLGKVSIVNGFIM